MRVLTVCLGNICRSPTAEAAIRREADAAGLALEVDSAGTGDWHIGELADERMRRAAASTGLELTSRARQVDPTDLEHFDLILPMDRQNLAHVRGMANGRPRAGLARIELFRRWDPAASGDLEVPDPYYGGADGFAEVVEICRRTAEALVAELASS